jgi:ABC-type iron transport system FetAB permease component
MIFRNCLPYNSILHSFSGQIMGGASPDVASHYQILLVVLIITSSIIGVWISVVLAV